MFQKGRVNLIPIPCEKGQSRVFQIDSDFADGRNCCLGKKLIIERH